MPPPLAARWQCRQIKSPNKCSAISKKLSSQVLIIREMGPRKILFVSGLISNIIRLRMRYSRNWESIPVDQSAPWIATHLVIFAIDGADQTENTGSKHPSFRETSSEMVTQANR